jgi:hypothetical protein
VGQRWGWRHHGAKAGGVGLAIESVGNGEIVGEGQESREG